MHLYWAWVAAFLLKLIGATADVSWHFQHLRETLAIPHVINGIGFFLAAGLLAYQMVYRKYSDVVAIRTVWVGLATFLVAAPLDELYHRIYGLDLTAWSPTHALLYIGTFLMIAGTAAGFLKSPEATANPHRAFWLSLIICLFLMEDVLFPLGQQEYGSVARWLVNHGRSIADADLLARVSDPFHQTYGGFPLALYPVYLVGAYVFCMGLARRFIAHRWAATLATGLYLLFRATAWTIFHYRGMPVSFVPYFTLGMAAMAGFAGLGLAGLLADLLMGPPVQDADRMGARRRASRIGVI